MFATVDLQQLCVARHERTRRRLSPTMWSLVLAALSVIAATPTAQSQLPPPHTNGTIHNASLQLCLQPIDGSKDLGAAIVQEPCDGSLAQKWKSVSVPKARLHYVNQLSGLCLDVRGGPANYTPVEQWTCDSITNENWYYALGFGAPAPTLYSAVANTGTGGGPLFCLDLPGNQPIPRLHVQIFQCNGTAAQRWYAP
jgi:hypothetical protein